MLTGCIIYVRCLNNPGIMNVKKEDGYLTVMLTLEDLPLPWLALVAELPAGALGSICPGIGAAIADKTKATKAKT